MKRCFLLIIILLIVAAYVAADEDTEQSTCEFIGYGCKQSCSEGESEYEEALTTPCPDGTICCKTATQAETNPESDGSTCEDGTTLNTCSQKLKSNYCTDQRELIEDCIKCGCQTQDSICNPDGSCTLPASQGQQSTDLSLVNRPPIVAEVPKLSIPFKFDMTFYVTDPEKKQITFTFQDGSQTSTTDTSKCNIAGSLIECNSGTNTGDSVINIIASDGSKSSTLQIEINNQFKKTEKKEINFAPRAEAGDNIVVYPNQRVVLDASKTTDDNGNLIFQDSSFTWKIKDKIIGKGISLITRFDKPGQHIIDLEVTDSEGSTGTDKVIIIVQTKGKCVNTTASYFPPDTICNNKWPSQEGDIIAINDRNNACDLVEVCDPGLDPIIEDSIDCCDGTPLTEPRKANACKFANKHSQGNTKGCQGLYLIKGIGDNAIYMQDYFEAEMCCYGVEKICSRPSNLYTAKPIPKTQSKPTNIQCKTTQENKVLGEWVSDSRIDLNNIALKDLHTGASVNVLSTGTCVDYGFALVTLLRKAGYSKEEAYLVEAPNHAYSLVRLPLDRKFHIVDTTGNNAPSIVLGGTPYGYDYCRNMVNCYNDHGKLLCPELSMIVGCEGVKEGFIKTGSRISYKSKEVTKKIASLFTEEATR